MQRLRQDCIARSGHDYRSNAHLSAQIHHTAQRRQCFSHNVAKRAASSGCLQALEERETYASQAVSVFGGAIAKVAGTVGRDMPSKSVTGQKVHAFWLAGARVCATRVASSKGCWRSDVRTCRLGGTAGRMSASAGTAALLGRQVFGGAHHMPPCHMMKPLASSMFAAR